MIASARVENETAPSFRGWIGPALFIGAAAQFLLGNAILADFPARPFNLIGDFGLTLVMTSPLTLTAGIGEAFNWLAARFKKNR